MAESTRPQPIAIVGLAGRFPGARGLDGFWRNVRDGVESIETFTDADLDAAGIDPGLRAHPSYVRKGTILEDADHFDASFFGFPPREAQTLDPQQRIFLECTWEALEHAGYAGSAAGRSVGVYAGVGLNTYVINQLIKNPAFVASVGGYQLMVGNDKDFLATRVAYKLDLRGPSITVQTACSTSLVAVEMACRALQHGECDMALAGGVAVLFPQRGGYLFEEGMILSPDGHCRPFDVQAKGTRSGAGAGVVVLKRLADAVADRDTIHGVILGAAVNNDGAGKAGYTAPSVEGQVEVIALAQALAGVDPRSITYVEAHGTGTPLGDPIEVAALTQAFRASTQDVGFCRIGSLKANIGHLDAAAGVAGLIKTVLAMTHREIPPLVNFRSPNPRLDLERSPFVASATLSPWTTTDGTPRRAGVSSFGIGGTNAHVVLEEAPGLPASTPLRDARLLVLSAKTQSALDRATANLGAHLKAHPDLPLADVDWTLKVGRQPFAHRRAVVVKGAKHAAEVLAQPQSPALLSGTYEGNARPVTFLFSGQGSQHVGMGRGLYETERVYRDAIDRCATILEPHLGLDIRKVLFGDDSGVINETRLTQPLLFATEYALASLWTSWGIVPSAMLGHSIGEYVAAHLAGVFSLEDALAVVAARGRLMQTLPSGSMAAVHLAGPELERYLTAGVEIAAFNAPGLCTVSGTTEAVAALLSQLEAKGIESRALHTSHAFHSAMMDPALGPFTALLEKITLSPPKIPYASNLTGTWVTPDQATSPAYYAKHLRHAVRFEAGVRTVSADPANVLLEVGPGNALTTLARLTLGVGAAKRSYSSLSHPRERRPDAEAALEAAARLWLAGAPIDWSGMHEAEQLRRVPLPTYPFERARYWVDALAGDARQVETSATSPRKRAKGWLYAPTWTRDDAADPSPPRLEGTWLVLTQLGPLGEAVVKRARAAGAKTVVVEPGERFERIDAEHFRVRPGVEEDLAGVIRDVGPPVAGAIYLWALSAERTPIALRYDGLVTLAAGLETSFGDTPLPVIVAMTGAESVLAEPVARHDAAVMLGPVLVLPTELRGLRMRAVDVDLESSAVPGHAPTFDAVAEEIASEAARADDERVVARRGRRRWVRRFEPFSLPEVDPTRLPFKQRGVYLITGGLGGIGLTLARWLASHSAARLVLTARTPLPPREEWDGWAARHGEGDRASLSIQNIREIEKAGGEVLVGSADAADESAMRRAIDDAKKRWGNIDGVIHAAGVPGTGTIALRKKEGEVEACLAPKVDGLDVLVRLLGDTPLDFVALQSSINSVLGAPGACDYASANAVLDAFVDSAACPKSWRRVVSLNWGPWRDVGMAAKRVAAEPTGQALEMSISPAAGADVFARVLASGRRRVVVAPFDLAFAIEQSTRAAEPAEAARVADTPRGPTAGAPAAQERPVLSTSFVAPSTATERCMSAIWSELLGVESIGIHDDFFELGGHSLLATRVLARVDDLLGVRLTLRTVFEAPTIHRLSARADQAETSTTPAAPAEDREEVEF